MNFSIQLSVPKNRFFLFLFSSFIFLICFVFSLFYYDFFFNGFQTLILSLFSFGIILFLFSGFIFFLLKTINEYNLINTDAFLFIERDNNVFLFYLVKDNNKDLIHSFLSDVFIDGNMKKINRKGFDINFDDRKIIASGVLKESLEFKEIVIFKPNILKPFILKDEQIREILNFLTFS